MCGIAGILEPRVHDVRALEARARAMATRLAHRGPDDEGVHVDGQNGLALAFRRLAVRDLSSTGRQPMRSDDGALTLVYNGELYDTDALASELDGPLTGTSDTEILLRTIARIGVERTLPKLSGMFAFALFDARTRTLTVARDRFGKKPLLLFEHAHGILFASELHALREDPHGPSVIDDESVRLFFRQGVVPGVRSIYQGARKLPPGTSECFRVEDGRVTSRGPFPYFTLGTLVPTRAEGRVDFETGVRLVEGALTDAVRRRLVSDVPLGAFLSSGVDSSLVVALMRAVGVERPRTFTIGTPGSDDDESVRARAIAHALGTEHHELMVTPSHLLAALDELPQIYDEPFADSSAVPTLLVSRLARAHVTVALSGDGADELFCGYRQHGWVRQLWPLLARLPRTVRARLRSIVEGLPETASERALAPARLLLSRFTPAARYLSHDAILKLARAIARPDAMAFHAHFRTLFDDETNPRGAPSTDDARHLAFFENHVVDAMRMFDLATYLTDDILVKVDRASMSCGLEVRSPFLDDHVVRAAFALAPDNVLPIGTSPDGRAQKRVLREVLKRHMPLSLLSPVKRGFSVPMSAWLRGPLKPHLDEVTTKDALLTLGLDVERVTRVKAAHLSGARSFPQELFAVLVWARFFARHERRSSSPSSPPSPSLS
jgi:asparagine synthase (glutamine-hydrolysing)